MVLVNWSIKCEVHDILVLWKRILMHVLFLQLNIREHLHLWEPIIECLINRLLVAVDILWSWWLISGCTSTSRVWCKRLLEIPATSTVPLCKRLLEILLLCLYISGLVYKNTRYTSTVPLPLAFGVHEYCIPLLFLCISRLV